MSHSLRSENLPRRPALARRDRQSGPLQQTSHWWHRWKISTQKFALVLSGVAFLTGFGYVLLTNNTAAQGFAIKRLEGKINAIQEENERLELQAADLRALSSVQLSSQTLDLEPADQFEYLTPTSSTVAVKP